MSIKHCTRCKTNKPISEFGKNKNEKDGHSVYCKVCYSGIMRAYRLKLKNTSPEPVIPPPNWKGRNPG